MPAARCIPRAPRAKTKAAVASALAAAAQYGSGATEALVETLWPTRCAVCDTPGEVLCGRCRILLSYIDWWRACPRCGAPFGRVQCTECNDVVLAGLGRDAPAYDGCAAAVVYDEAAARVVRTWKDSGERRLADVMGGLMAQAAPPAWRALGPAVVPVPATAAARRRRGFDHGEELAQTVAARLGLPTASVLARPRTRDQRALGRRGRVRNMEGRFRTLPGATVPRHALVVDDVSTTGATLAAVCDALRDGGALTVHCLTFARVW